MKFAIRAALEYKVVTESTIILNIHALKTACQHVLEESFTIKPYMKSEELITPNEENRFMRIEIPVATTLQITYDAIADNYFTITDHTSQQQVKVAELDTSVLPYLYPSRYCQSDKLYRLAGKKFGHIANPYAQVIALTDWIHRNIEYLSGSTNAQTSAYDTVTEHAGVCRDFAHLGIALCRALTIPARYFTGYACQLNPPDLHACFEAFLGGEWVLFDATRLAPLNGMVKIAHGRDAADTAIANIFGNAFCTDMRVSCEATDPGFRPFFYNPAVFKGIAYL